MFLEDASPIKRAMPSNNAIDLQSAEARIRDAYNRYVSSRATFIKSYEESCAESRPQDRKDIKSGPSVDPRDNTGKPKNLTLPISKLLPYLPHLTQTASNERSLLQQSLYLENQIASADQDIEEALLRLSGESHLLPAGSKRVAAWGKTAADAETTNTQFVKEHFDASQQELGSVNAVVELCSLQSKVLASS